MVRRAVEEETGYGARGVRQLHPRGVLPVVVELVGPKLGPLQRAGRYLEPRVPAGDVDVGGVQVAAAQQVVFLGPAGGVEGVETVEKAGPGRLGDADMQKHLHRADYACYPNAFHEHAPRLVGGGP